MGQVSRKLKKYILGIALGIALMCGKESYAQYNREYFFWVGRSCMMNNDYQEAIRTLNTLLRFDEDAFEGYFLRGIAKYNLDDLLGAEADSRPPSGSTPYTHKPIPTARSRVRGWVITMMPCRTSARRSTCARICRGPITAAA